MPEITLGGLVVEHVPTARVRIPALEKFGPERPELILGYGFFVGLATRVDYIHNEITFAEKRTDLPAGGDALTLRVLSGKIVANLTIDREEVPVVLDTGSAGALDLYKRWASSHAAIEKGALGPLSLDSVHATTIDAPEPGILAGVIGNAALARCDAITIDLRSRTLTLEGSCAKRVTER